MNTHSLKTDDLIVITYGNGTQIARVRRVTRTGSVEVNRFIPPYMLGDPRYTGRWHESKTAVHAAKVLSLAPPSDPRVALALACDNIVEAR